MNGSQKLESSQKITKITNRRIRIRHVHSDDNR